MGVLLADMPSDASNVRMGFEVGNAMFQEISSEHHVAIQEIEIVTAAHLGMQVGHQHRIDRSWVGGSASWMIRTGNCRAISTVRSAEPTIG